MSTSRSYCSVDGCRNRPSNKLLSFFKLPKDKDRCKKWLELIGRPDMDRPNLKPECYIVCSVHFERDLITMIPRLQSDAMPTKYLPNSKGSCSSSVSETCLDATTQTDGAEVAETPINLDVETVGVQTDGENMHSKQTQTTGDDVCVKRKIQNKINESERKRKRQ